MRRKTRAPSALIEDDESIKDRAWKRVRGMSSHSLLDYIDTASAGMNQGYDDFRRERKIESLTEIRKALLVLLVLIEELMTRCEQENS